MLRGLAAFFGLSLQAAVIAALPVVDIAALPEVPDDGQAAMIVILTTWNPIPAEYSELAKDPKICIEDFNILACLQSKSGVSMKEMWRWRKLHLGWQEIVAKVKLSLDDVVPKSEKKWPEPYMKCWTYWRERGGSSSKAVVADYDFEKLVEVMTLQKATEKPVDTVIELLQKGASFRSLSAAHLSEKAKATKWKKPRK